MKRWVLLCWMQWRIAVLFWGHRELEVPIRLALNLTWSYTITSWVLNVMLHGLKP